MGEAVWVRSSWVFAEEVADKDGANEGTRKDCGSGDIGISYGGEVMSEAGWMGSILVLAKGFEGSEDCMRCL